MCSSDLEVLPEYFQKFESIEEEAEENPAEKPPGNELEERQQEKDGEDMVDANEVSSDAPVLSDESSDDEENLSQDEIQAMISQMQGEETSDNEDIEPTEPTLDETSDSDDETTEELADVVDEKLAEEDESNSDDHEMMTADDIEALLRGTDDSDGAESAELDDHKLEPESEGDQNDLETESVAQLQSEPTDDDSDLLIQDGFDEIADQDEEPSLDSSQGQESNAFANPSSESESIPSTSENLGEELTDKENSAEEPSESVPSESDDQMMSKEELSAMLSQEDEQEQKKSEKIDDQDSEDLSEPTQEKIVLENDMEVEMQGSTQFNPPPKTKVSETGQRTKETFQALLSKVKSNLKFVIPATIGLVAMGTAGLLYPSLRKPNAPAPSLAHPAEAWKWRRNPDSKSTVKYQIYAPGVTLSLSHLAGVEFSDLIKNEGAPLKEYYEDLEKKREILRFRLLGEVKYFKTDNDIDPTMIHYDYFFRDLENKNHLKRAVYFKISEMLLKIEFSALSEDGDLTSSESEAASNLNGTFKSVFGISDLQYLPEFVIEIGRAHV